MELSKADFIEKAQKFIDEDNLIGLETLAILNRKKVNGDVRSIEVPKIQAFVKKHFNTTGIHRIWNRIKHND